MYYETWNCIMFKVFCIQYVLVKWKGTSVLYLFRWLFYSLDDGNLFIDFWIPDCQEDIGYLADVKNSWTLYLNLIVCSCLKIIIEQQVNEKEQGNRNKTSHIRPSSLIPQREQYAQITHRRFPKHFIKTDLACADTQVEVWTVKWRSYRKWS